MTGIPRSLSSYQTSSAKISVSRSHVAGFATHPHAMWIIRQIKSSRYDIEFCGVMDIQSCAATSPPRWFCLGVLNNQENICEVPFIQGFPEKLCTLAGMGAILTWDETHANQLKVPDKALAKKHSLLPSNMRISFIGDEDMSLQSRCYRMLWGTPSITR